MSEKPVFIPTEFVAASPDDPTLSAVLMLRGDNKWHWWVVAKSGTPNATVLAENEEDRAFSSSFAVEQDALEAMAKCARERNGLRALLHAKTAMKHDGLWRHNKTGRHYKVLCVALEESSFRVVVVYQSFRGEKVFTRPYSEWDESVKTDNGEQKPRFERVTNGADQ